MSNLLIGVLALGAIGLVPMWIGDGLLSLFRVSVEELDTSEIRMAAWLIGVVTLSLLFVAWLIGGGLTGNLPERWL